MHAEPQLDEWIDDPALRVRHRRESTASADELWQAAREVPLSDTALLGRLVRWRIPGLAREATYDALFREPPFVILEEGERMLVSGLAGRIWTLRRDYPRLSTPDEFRAWSQGGTARVVFAHWSRQLADGRATLASEVRVQPIGVQGRIGLAAVRPLVRSFQQLVGSDGITAAVRRAERSGRTEQRIADRDTNVPGS
jgi:hypothetical protein